MNPTQLAVQAWRRVLLQASWARGKDLAQMPSFERAHPPSPDTLWDGSFWDRLQALPLRAHWAYQESNVPYRFLDERHVIIPGLADRYHQTWLGAEAGARMLVANKPCASEHSYLLTAADWPTTVQRARLSHGLTIDRPVPRHTQETVLEQLPPDTWARDPFRETCGGVRRAIVSGLLWPGHAPHAKAAAWADASAYTGAAMSAQAYFAAVAAEMLTDPEPDVVAHLRMGLNALPVRSQIRVIGEWTYQEYTTGMEWADWLAQLAQRCHYYPANHVVPNVAWILAGIWWGQNDWRRVWPLVVQPGFDPLTRSVVTGALWGLARARLPALPDVLTLRLIRFADDTLMTARLYTIIR